MPSTPARGRGQACYPTSWNGTIRHGTEVLRSLTPHGQSHLAGCPRWLSTIRSNSYLFWSSYSWITDVMSFIKNERTSRAFTLAAVMWSSLSWAFKSEFISSSRRACIRQTNGLWLEATDTWSYLKKDMIIIPGKCQTQTRLAFRHSAWLFSRWYWTWPVSETQTDLLE